MYSASPIFGVQFDTESQPEQDPPLPATDPGQDDLEVVQAGGQLDTFAVRGTMGVKHELQ